MKIGVPVGNFGNYGKSGGASELLEIAERAELLGYDSVWLHDHLLMPASIRSRYPYNEAGVAGFAWRQDIYDPLALMGAIAVRTQRIHIGTSVLIIPYRNPLVLAKMLATADRLSHGRILLGIGVGWMREEFEQLGIGEYYPVRGRVTDEWMRICLSLWAEGSSSHQGEQHGFEEVGAYPKPWRGGRVPIWVGGKGDIAARRTARYGDGYHSITSTPDELREEIALLHRELERAGREPADVVISMLGPTISLDAAAVDLPATLSGSTQELIDGLVAYKEAGLQHAELVPMPGAPVTPRRYMDALQYLAEEVLPALR
jgi:probable F420-dependent oxidoreductase